jgi:hypothetical protein
MLPRASDSDAARAAEGFGFGVVVHVSPQHRLAHVHFDQEDLLAAVGSELGVYETIGAQRRLVAVLQVVEAFPGSANVTGADAALATIARGDMVLRPPGTLTAHKAASEPLKTADAPAPFEADEYTVNVGGVAYAPADPPVVQASSELITVESTPISPRLARRPVAATFMR